MADWVKKVTKNCGEELAPGETVQAATFVNAKGNITRMAGFGGVGGVVGGVIGEVASSGSRKEAAAAKEGGVAAEVPPVNAVLALTDQRFCVFAHSSLSGKPKELLWSIERSRVTGIEVGDGALTMPLQVGFDDGSALLYQAVKGAKPKAFAEAF